MRKGFYLSLGELIALLLVASALLALPESEEPSFKELVVLQKEHDLLKVWGKTLEFEEKELVQDFQEVFPNRSGFVEIDGKKLSVGEKQEASLVVAEGWLFDSTMNLRHLRIGVFR